MTQKNIFTTRPASQWVWWGGLGLATLLMIAAALTALALRKKEIEDWRNQMHGMSLVLSEQTSNAMYPAFDALDDMDRLLLAYKHLSQDKWREHLSTLDVHQILKEKVSRSSLLDVISVVAANGDNINYSRSHPVRGINLADREYFQRHKNNPRLGDYVTEPVRNKGTGKWTFYLSRRINDKNGEFAGVLLVGVSIERLVRFYDKVVAHLGEGASISLFREDLRLLARTPHLDELIGKVNTTGSAYVLIHEKGMQEGTLISDAPRFSSGKAVTRLGAVYPVSGYAMYVTIVVSDDLYLSVWRRTAWLVGLLTLVSMAALLMGTRYLSRVMRRREQDLRDMEALKNQAIQANLAKSSFLATMSHEIRTPMNGVLGLAQVMQMPSVSDAERLSHARTLYKSGQTLMQLLNDILDFSKIEAGKMQLYTQVCDPSEIVQDVAKLFAAPAQAKGLSIQVQSEPGSFYVCDALRLRQMLSNLVNNAIKFTQQGFVEMRVSELARQGDSAILEFSVSDTGIGMTEQEQASLFLPFSQVGGMENRFLGGTGLGLSTVKALSELMGGQVGVASAPSGGSKFWFTVRVEPTTQFAPEVSHAPSAPEVQDTENHSKTSGSILVAEDNSTNMIVIRTVLEKMGHQVHGVVNGQAAVEAVLSGVHFDLVLMDVQMPVMDGLEAAHRIRDWERKEQKSRVPILALTAAVGAQDLDSCRQAGIDDVLAKPINVSAVKHMLAVYLGHSGKNASEF